MGDQNLLGTWRGNASDCGHRCFMSVCVCVPQPVDVPGVIFEAGAYDTVWAACRPAASGAVHVESIWQAMQSTMEMQRIVCLFVCFNGYETNRRRLTWACLRGPASWLGSFGFPLTKEGHPLAASKQTEPLPAFSGFLLLHLMRVRYDAHLAQWHRSNWPNGPKSLVPTKQIWPKIQNVSACDISALRHGADKHRQPLTVSKKVLRGLALPPKGGQLPSLGLNRSLCFPVPRSGPVAGHWSEGATKPTEGPGLVRWLKLLLWTKGTAPCLEILTMAISVDAFHRLWCSHAGTLL